MKSIRPSEIKGTVHAPPSKSMAIRAVAAAYLSPGKVRIENPSLCEDGLQAIRIIEAMGAGVGKEEGALSIGSRGLTAAEGEGNDRALRHSHAESRRGILLDCGESGLCMRMFAPIAALSGEDTILTAIGSLSTRPMAMVEGLRAREVRCATANGFAPISLRGPLKGGPIEVDGSVTSQFLTGLLMALPCCGEDSTVSVTRLASVPYVKMTLSLLESFGVSIAHDEEYKTFGIRGNQEYKAPFHRVEGDWSAGAFLLVAGAIAGSVLVEGLCRDSCQADKAVMDALAEAGAMIAVGKDSVYVEHKSLRPFSFDASHCPDLFPPLVALASRCGGKSTIRGASRLAHKESDRARTLAAEFGKMGIAIDVSGDVMTVDGGALKGARVDSHRDHRIAMACAVAACAAEGPTLIENWESVSKSYPHFFRDLNALQVAS